MFSKNKKNDLCSSPPEYNLDYDEAIVDQYFSVQKPSDKNDELIEDSNVAEFVE